MSTQFSFGASRTGGALGEARPSTGGGEGAGTSTALGFPPSEARGRQGRAGHAWRPPMGSSRASEEVGSEAKRPGVEVLV